MRGLLNLLLTLRFPFSIRHLRIIVHSYICVPSPFSSQYMVYHFFPRYPYFFIHLFGILTSCSVSVLPINLYIPFLSYVIYLLLLLPIFHIFSTYHSPPLPHFLSSFSFQVFIFLRWSLLKNKVVIEIERE